MANNQVQLGSPGSPSPGEEDDLPLVGGGRGGVAGGDFGPREDWEPKFCCPHVLSCLCYTIWCPACFLCSFKTVNVGEELVVLAW
jgi:hypothetical protein